MNKIVTNLKFHFSKKMKDQRGQGMLEYILLVVVVVGLVLFLKEPLTKQVTEIKDKLGSSVSDIIK